MDQTYYIVTDGTQYVFWDNQRGCWNCTETFNPKCLLDDTDASSVQRQFNHEKHEDDSAWVIREAFLAVEKWYTDQTIGGDANQTR